MPPSPAATAAARQARRRQWLTAVAAAVVEEVASRRRCNAWVRAQSAAARHTRQRFDTVLQEAGHEVVQDFLASMDDHPLGGVSRELTSGEVVRLYQVGSRWALSVRDGQVLYVSNRTYRTQHDAAAYLLEQIAALYRDEGLDLEGGWTAALWLDLPCGH
jgi:hypothetical protein